MPNAPDLEFSTRQHHTYLLNHFIGPKFGNVPIREMKALMIEEWLQSLCGVKCRPLAGTTKSSIRTLLSKCFKLAAKHEFISAFEQNPMHLIDLKGVSKRQKEIQQITVEQFKSIRADLPEVLNVLVLVDASIALRISELLALKCEDLEVRRKPSPFAANSPGDELERQTPQHRARHYRSQMGCSTSCQIGKIRLAIQSGYFPLYAREALAAVQRCLKKD